MTNGTGAIDSLTNHNLQGKDPAIWQSALDNAHKTFSDPKLASYYFVAITEDGELVCGLGLDADRSTTASEAILTATRMFVNEITADEMLPKVVAAYAMGGISLGDDQPTAD